MTRYAQMLPRNVRFIVIGDAKSPREFHLEKCQFYSIEAQEALGFALTEKLPHGHYARKNIGYLLAMREQSDSIYETDDDNLPYDDFFAERSFQQKTHILQGDGWYNIYPYFLADKARVWARGYPLEKIKEEEPFALTDKEIFTPIMQGLANGDPDVDAIYRLTGKLPLQFLPDKHITLAGRWSPFNSQNTIWHPCVYALLYLPSYCSFRMCDIWRSFIAQRICFANGWGIHYFSPTVWQERNAHHLLADLADEYAGYLHNAKIVEALCELSLRKGEAHLTDNLMTCYNLLVEREWIDEKELDLVARWIQDMTRTAQK